MKPLLIISLMLLTACANTRLVVPLATTHVVVSGDRDYNNKNYGLGLEVVDNDLSYGVLYVPENSFNEKSTYLTLSKKHPIDKDLFVFIGAFAANGYEEILSSKNGYVASPVYGFEYYSFKLTTTYPFSKYSCRHDPQCADFFNLSWIHKFK
jgi:hypothetical protein